MSAKPPVRSNRCVRPFSTILTSPFEQDFNFWSLWSYLFWCMAVVLGPLCLINSMSMSHVWSFPGNVVLLVLDFGPVNVWLIMSFLIFGSSHVYQFDLPNIGSCLHWRIHGFRPCDMPFTGLPTCALMMRQLKAVGQHVTFLIGFRIKLQPASIAFARLLLDIVIYTSFARLMEFAQLALTRRKDSPPTVGKFICSYPWSASMFSPVPARAVANASGVHSVCSNTCVTLASMKTAVYPSCTDILTLSRLHCPFTCWIFSAILIVCHGCMLKGLPLFLPPLAGCADTSEIGISGE